MDVHVKFGSVTVTGGKQLLAKGARSVFVVSDQIVLDVKYEHLSTVRQPPLSRLYGMRRAGFSPSTVFSSHSRLHSDGLPSIDNQSGTKWRDFNGQKSAMWERVLRILS